MEPPLKTTKNRDEKSKNREERYGRKEKVFFTGFKRKLIVHVEEGQVSFNLRGFRET